MLKTFRNKIKNIFKNFSLYRKGILIDLSVSYNNVTFLGKAKIEPYCRLYGDPKIIIGNNFYMNADCHLLGEITIGDDVQIGPQTVIWGRDHLFAKKTKINQQGYLRASITIGNDVWIGAHVTILKGIKIGNGAVIGAGSVITKNIPNNAIIVGNPGKIVRYRV